MMERRIRTWQVLGFLCLAAIAVQAQPQMPAPIIPQAPEPPAAEPTPPPAPAPQVAPQSPSPALAEPAPPPTPPVTATPPRILTQLQWTWTNADHPSGIYYAKSDATFTIIIDNPTDHPLSIGGQILFGSHDTSSTPPASNPAADTFKPLAIIPVTPADLQPGQRAKIPLSVTFAAVGTYELRSVQDQTTIPVTNAAGISLECIFAPREAPATAPSTARPDETPWITTLPKSAVLSPGYITDYIRQTTVHRFLVDERFAFDPQTRVGLGFGASLNAGSREVDALLAEAFLAKAGIVLRVTVPTADGAADDRTLAGFQQYLRDAIRRSHGALKALVITPDIPGRLNPAQQAAFRAFYLAGYQTAKREDKTLLMLGAGTAPSTQQLLLAQNLVAYIDAFAITDAAAQPAQLQQINNEALRPFWVLPPALSDPTSHTPAPPAAALAAGAAVAPLPPPAVDHGVAVHLLNGTVLFQRVHPADTNAADLPFVAVFQGDSYAVAAIAGLSAGTPIDALFPTLARTPTIVAPATPDENPSYPNLEASDDTHAMRVVDAAGLPVECPQGGSRDTIFIPAGDKMVYLLQGGMAEDLAGSLRPANRNRLPVLEISASFNKPGPDAMTLTLRNITTAELAGKLRLIRPQNPAANANQPAELLAEKEFPPIAPNQTLELPLDPHSPASLKQLTSPLILEITTPAPHALIQRTAIRIE